MKTDKDGSILISRVLCGGAADKSGESCAHGSLVLTNQIPQKVVGMWWSVQCVIP